MKNKVCVVTGTRAEFGLLLPLLRRLHAEKTVELQLVVTGSHLLAEFGNTQNEIEQSGIPVFARIPIQLSGDSKTDMAISTGEAISAFADYFSLYRPDLLILLGDRFEIFSAATAAALQGIAIAHIHGGETTEGAVDEFLRHAITKMSYLHFTACDEYRRRVIQLGEAPERVFNVGALGVENIIHFPTMDLGKLSEELAFDLQYTPYVIVTLHPVTQEGKQDEGRQIYSLIEAMDKFPHLNYLITKANADAGGRRINEIWEKELPSHNNWTLVASLGVCRYLSALKNAKMVLGNSSSGIIEAPALHIPAVNVGSRQSGRIMASSVISCDSSTNAIASAIEQAISEPFQELAKKTVCPFGDGNTSDKIFRIVLEYVRSEKQGIKKKFYDISYEIRRDVDKEIL